MPLKQERNSAADAPIDVALDCRVVSATEVGTSMPSAIVGRS